VAQDVLVNAPGILKGIGQHGHPPKGTLLVDAFRKGKDV
jgi:hypothetical protein